MLGNEKNKFAVCKFYHATHHLHAGVQSSTCASNGKYLRESVMKA